MTLQEMDRLNTELYHLNYERKTAVEILQSQESFLRGDLSEDARRATEAVIATCREQIAMADYKIQQIRQLLGQ